MKNKCPMCNSKIISIKNRPGVKCSKCSWISVKPKPPPPPPRVKKDKKKGYGISILYRILESLEKLNQIHLQNQLRDIDNRMHEELKSKGLLKENDIKKEK